MVQNCMELVKVFCSYILYISFNIPRAYKCNFVNITDTFAYFSILAAFRETTAAILLGTYIFLVFSF